MENPLEPTQTAMVV